MAICEVVKNSRRGFENTNRALLFCKNTSLVSSKNVFKLSTTLKYDSNISLGVIMSIRHTSKKYKMTILEILKKYQN